MIDTMYKAICMEIQNIDPSARIYRDNVPQNFKTPAYLVLITDTESIRRLNKRRKITHSIDILYYPDGKIQEYRSKCENKKQEMLRHFEVISADGVSFYVKGKTSNIIDDVLHILMEISYTEYLKQLVPKMEEIFTDIRTEG